MGWTEGGLCARDGWLKADPKRSQTITQQISSLVLICDAKTWSHKKEEKEMYWACQMFWPLDCLFTLNRERTLYKRWLTKGDPQRSQTVTQQISSLVLICDAKAWSHKKEEKELQWVSWIFQPLNCLYTLNREWTLCKRLVTKGWSTKAQLVSPNKHIKKDRRLPLFKNCVTRQ